MERGIMAVLYECEEQLFGSEEDWEVCYTCFEFPYWIIVLEETEVFSTSSFVFSFIFLKSTSNGFYFFG